MHDFSNMFGLMREKEKIEVWLQDVWYFFYFVLFLFGL